MRPYENAPTQIHQITWHNSEPQKLSINATSNSFMKSSFLIMGSAALVGGIAWGAKLPARQPYVPLAAVGQANAAPSFERDVKPVIAKYCLSCHAGEDAAAGLDLSQFKNVEQVLKDGETWESVARNVGESHMPPRKHPQPTAQQRERLVAWIESTLSQAYCNLDDPGRVTLRRLNREEYNNTVRDLFGVTSRPADAFPTDDIGYGFDNIGDVLSMSPLLLEKYLSAAEKVSAQAIVAPDGDIRIVNFTGEKFTPDSAGGISNTGARMLASHGEVKVDYDFAQAGQYVLRVNAWAEQAGDEAPKMPLSFDGKVLQTFEVKAKGGKAQSYEFALDVEAGKHRVGAAFINDFYDESRPQGQRDRNLVVESIEIEGPRLKSIVPNASHLKILPQTSDKSWSAEKKAQYTRERISILARRVFRRPPGQNEIARLAQYVSMVEKDGGSYERGMQVALQAMLVSPHFLFHVELDPPAGKDKRALNDYELATRLSYFLWNSAPDESLSWWANQGKLHESQHLAHQVRRMLKDPRASALSENFAMQWLQLRRLNDVAPDPETFPQWTPQLREAMQTETTMFCGEIIEKDRSILDFIDARFSYMNEPLAKLYGITNVKGDNFQRVIFTDAQAKERGGLLTQASVLTVTSNPTRTSPVKRGKWVLEQILGAPPPPAPPNVPALNEDKKVVAAAPIRERMAQHRDDPACSSCHARMDPIGFGMESFNGIGAWRLKDGAFRVDASGEFSDGQKFDGPQGLRKVLQGRKDVFARTLSEKLLTYAIGRGLERTDTCFVDDIVENTMKQDYKFSALVLSIVASEPFLTKSADVKKK